MDDEPSKDLFDTPILRYYKVRETFLKEFRNKKVWGKCGSRQRVIALQGLITYIKVTSKFRETWAKGLCRDIEADNIHLFTQYNQLPDLPNRLREKLFNTAYHIEDYDEGIARVIDMLEGEKSVSLSFIE